MFKVVAFCNYKLSVWTHLSTHCCRAV